MESLIGLKDYSYEEYAKIMKTIENKYPFVTKKSIGKSCIGRSIDMLTLGSGREKVLYIAAVHSSERITANILLRFFAELCESVHKGLLMSDIDVRRGLAMKSISVIPLVNPDGAEIARTGEAGCGSYAGMIRKLSGGDFEHWNSNLRGVDINHNFDAGRKELVAEERKAGIFGPSKSRYSGPFAESEPETAAITSVCREMNFRHAVALHTQGRVIYWNYGKKIPERSEKMAEIMASSSGYFLDTAKGLSAGGGFKDWFISEFERPAFTVEIGYGKNPLPIESADKLYREIKEMLTLVAIM